jgi:hypothetical protein
MRGTAGDIGKPLEYPIAAPSPLNEERGRGEELDHVSR